MMVPPEAVPDLMRERLGCPRCEAREGAIKPLVTAATELCESVESIIPGQPIPFAKGLFELVPRLASLRAALALYNVPRCEITGNPVGTDTRPIDSPCRCEPCSTALAPYREQTPAETPCPTCKGTRMVSVQMKVNTGSALGYVDSFHDGPCPDCSGGKDNDDAA